MLLTLEVSLSPGADLGYLLHKHPDRPYSAELPLGRLHVFFPVISEHSAKVALWLDVDPIGLVRRKGDDGPHISQYVNDRPYVASSLLSVALARCLGDALKGRSQERPELAQTALELTAQLSVVQSRGGAELFERLFGPLGYTVKAERLILDERFPDWGESPYYVLELRGKQRLADLLSHLYVLLPVLDRYKHYFIGPDEVDKLLARGQGWLETHPEQELIARRYLLERPSLTRLALDRLLPDSDEPTETTEDALEAPLSLNEQRIRAVLEQLELNQVRSLADIGCGEGNVLRRLLSETKIPRLIGIDVSPRELAKAEKRLRPDWLSERQKARLELIQGSVLYRDARYADVDAALLIEVIEHLEPFQIERLTRTLFGEQKPPLVLVSTPNREYNLKFGLAAHQLRHRDHRFEWNREEFHRWAARTAKNYGYLFESHPIGHIDPELGPPTQMAVFSRQEAEA